MTTTTQDLARDDEYCSQCELELSTEEFVTGHSVCWNCLSESRDAILDGFPMTATRRAKIALERLGWPYELVGRFLAAPRLAITTATTITGPCERCDEEPAVLRVYGQPHPDFDHPVECEEACTRCGPWVVSAALQQQVPWSDRPIQVEIQAGA